LLPRLGLATFFLEGGQLPTFLPARNVFPPFGAGINPAGEVVDFNCLPSPGNPGAFDVFCLPDQFAMFSDGKEEKLSLRLRQFGLRMRSSGPGG
jgi:hypothetical protein